MYLFFGSYEMAVVGTLNAQYRHLLRLLSARMCDPFEVNGEIEMRRTAILLSAWKCFDSEFKELAKNVVITTMNKGEN